MQIIVILLGTICLSELLSYATSEAKMYSIRYKIYHVYGIIEMLLQSLFYIYSVRPHYYRKIILLATIACPIIGILNITFLQPFDSLNNNMKMLESFSTITMSLYFIYWLLKNDKVNNIFKSSHFWIAVLWLLLWSGTFFFWAFVKLLYRGHWVYFKIVDHAQNVINIITYAGIAAVLILYRKNYKANENR